MEKHADYILIIFALIITALLIWNLVLMHSLTDRAIYVIETEREKLSDERIDRAGFGDDVVTEVIIEGDSN